MTSLVADYGSESDSNDSDDNDEGEKLDTLPKPKLELPKPDFVTAKGSESSNSVENSVFVNPFIEAVNAKNAILEKHVKMISTDVKMLNGKAICWNYRKSKCRFGHNCKFAHDSDIQVEQSTKDVEDPIPQNVKPVLSVKSDATNKRKRPGLSQTLVPGKRVMKMYAAQKKNKK